MRVASRGPQRPRPVLWEIFPGDPESCRLAPLGPLRAFFPHCPPARKISGAGGQCRPRYPAGRTDDRRRRQSGETRGSPFRVLRALKRRLEARRKPRSDRAHVTRPGTLLSAGGASRLFGSFPLPFSGVLVLGGSVFLPLAGVTKRPGSRCCGRVTEMSRVNNDNCFDIFAVSDNEVVMGWGVIR